MAAQEVRDRVNRVIPQLPRTIQQPTTTAVTAAAMELNSVGSVSLTGTNSVPLLAGQTTGAGIERG